MIFLPRTFCKSPGRSVVVQWLSCFLLVLLAPPTSLLAETYFPPANHRTDILLTNGWRFIRQNVLGAQKIGFDDSGWASVNLPHTWNNLDGQDGRTNYYRG